MNKTQLNLATLRIRNQNVSERWVLLSMILSAMVVAVGGLGAWSRAEAGHNTCALVAQVPGGEAAVEAWALTSLNTRLPFFRRFTVGHVPATNYPIRVDVDAGIKNPAKNVDIVCAPSGFSSRLDIIVRVVGRTGTSHHKGYSRIMGHYTPSPLSSRSGFA